MTRPEVESLEQALGLLLTTAAEEGLTDEGFHPETRRLWAEYSELLRRVFSGPPSGQESRAGGAAPQEPDFQKATRTLAALLGCADQPDREAATCYAAVVRATLDQAEKEIARLREENQRLQADALFRETQP